MVNPPGNEKASYRVNDENPADADEWLKSASEKPGTWWDDWVAWLAERSGEEKDAPAEARRRTSTSRSTRRPASTCASRR